MKAAFEFFSENPDIFVVVIMFLFVTISLVVLSAKAKKEMHGKSEAAEWLADRTKEEMNLIRLWTAFGNKHYGTKVTKETANGRAAFPKTLPAAIAA